MCVSSFRGTHLNTLLLVFVHIEREDVKNQLKAFRVENSNKCWSCTYLSSYLVKQFRNLYQKHTMNCIATYFVMNILCRQSVLNYLGCTCFFFLDLKHKQWWSFIRGIIYLYEYNLVNNFNLACSSRISFYM